VVWRLFDGTNWRIQARRWSASGTLSAVRTFSDPNQAAEAPQVAVDANGNAMVVWGLFDGTNWRIQARRRSASGTLSSVRTLSRAREGSAYPDVAVDTHGNAVVVWQFDDITTQIQTRGRSASGILSPVHPVSDPSQSAYKPQVAVDAGGNAVAVWEGFDGVHSRIQSSFLLGVQTLSEP